MDLAVLLKPLLVRWRLMLLTPIIAGAAGLAASYLITPIFSSTTTFLPPQQQQSSAASALASLGALAGLATGSAAIKSPAEQYVALMQSVTVSNRLVDQFKLQDVYQTKVREDARKALGEHASINIGKKDGLINVTVEDTVPQRAADIANQYVEELRRMTSLLAVTEAQQRRLFFQKQLDETKHRLASAQIALQQSGISAAALNTEPKTAAEEFARISAQLTAAEVRLQTMRSTLADGSAEIRQQSSAVEALRSQVAKRQRDKGPSGADSEYIDKYREFKYQETLFELMSRQYEMARVDESREGALVQVVDPAFPAERKIKPKRLFIGLGTAVFAFLILASLLIARQRLQSVAPEQPTERE
jgi:uncharacterized protein involved in exopolysaccharide biosynthesis